MSKTILAKNFHLNPLNLFTIFAVFMMQIIDAVYAGVMINFVLIASTIVL